MSDVDVAVETLHALRALGVSLSIDDFGTGHAALGYLRSLPVQTIKIDRSFVDGLNTGDPKATSIVDAIVSLARALDLDVVANRARSTSARALLVASCSSRNHTHSSPLGVPHGPVHSRVGGGAGGR